MRLEFTYKWVDIWYIENLVTFLHSDSFESLGKIEEYKMETSRNSDISYTSYSVSEETNKAKLVQNKWRLTFSLWIYYFNKIQESKLFTQKEEDILKYFFLADRIKIEVLLDLFECSLEDKKLFDSVYKSAWNYNTLILDEFEKFEDTKGTRNTKKIPEIYYKNLKFYIWNYTSWEKEDKLILSRKMSEAWWNQYEDSPLFILEYNKDLEIFKKIDSFILSVKDRLETFKNLSPIYQVNLENVDNLSSYISSRVSDNIYLWKDNNEESYLRINDLEKILKYLSKNENTWNLKEAEIITFLDKYSSLERLNGYKINYKFIRKSRHQNSGLIINYTKKEITFKIIEFNSVFKLFKSKEFITFLSLVLNSTFLKYNLQKEVWLRESNIFVTFLAYSKLKWSLKK